MTPPTPSASVFCVVLHHNGFERTHNCLCHLRELVAPQPRVIVVDNGSTDGSGLAIGHRFLEIELLRLETNRGFSGGNNEGVRRALEQGADFVWLLNDDCEVQPDSLVGLLDAMRDPKAGAAASVLLNHDGSIQTWGGGRVNFSLGLPSDNRGPREAEKTQYLKGASLLLRARALQQVGLLSEDFFLFWEDTDLGFRLRDAGWILRVAVRSRVRHLGGGTVRFRSLFWDYYFTFSSGLFFKRHAPLPLWSFLFSGLARVLNRKREGRDENARVVFQAVKDGLLKNFWGMEKVTPPPCLLKQDRPPRVMIAGLGKSGTTYLFSIVARSMPKETKHLFEPVSFDYRLIGQPVLAKVLLGMACDLDTFRSFEPIIVLVRDPRDRLVSRMLYEAYGGPVSTLHSDEEHLKRFLALLRNKITKPSSTSFETLLREAMPHHLAQGIAPIQQQQQRSINFVKTLRSLNKPHCVLKYEDLIQGRLEQVENLLQLDLHTETRVPHQFKRVERSLSRGEWRHWFTPSDVDVFAPLCREFMTFFDYQDDWQLAPQQTISEETSLNYVLRLVDERRAHPSKQPKDLG